MNLLSMVQRSPLAIRNRENSNCNSTPDSVLFHHCGLEWFRRSVVCDPFPHLLAVFEVSRAHSSAVFAEPLPVSVHLAGPHSALAVDGTVFVIMDMLGDFGSCGHGTSSSLLINLATSLQSRTLLRARHRGPQDPCRLLPQDPVAHRLSRRLFVPPDQSPCRLGRERSGLW